jgi:hypothetical protein
MTLSKMASKHQQVTPTQHFLPTCGFKDLTTWLKAETGRISCHKARHNDIWPGTPQSMNHTSLMSIHELIDKIMLNMLI